jgi:hypothetical protein
LTGAARAPLALAFFISLAGGGCMIEMAAQVKGPRAPPLRATPEVRAALYASDPDVESIIGARLAQRPHLTLDPVEAGVRERYRRSCGVLGCDDAVLRDWARARGDDVIVLERMVVQRRGIAVCDRYQFGTGPGDPGHCAEEHIENEEADVRLEVATWLTAPDVRYRRLRDGSLTLTASAAGPGAQARARSDVAAQLSPDVIADALPGQTMVDAAAHLDRENAPDGSVFAVMRDGKRQGLVRVTGAGSPGQHLDSLYCCLSVRPTDAMILRPPQLLWELLPDAGALRVSVGDDARLAASLGLALRVRTLDRGWRTGVAVERVFAGDARLWLGTFELGYGFRPSAAWALAPVLGVGGGQAERDAATSGSITSAGAHAAALLRATFEPTRFVYLTLDLGLVGSLGYRSWKSGGTAIDAEPLGLNGPVIRFAASVR